jgi:ribosomal protein S18 acetylase RimI-like enzyme
VDGVRVSALRNPGRQVRSIVKGMATNPIVRRATVADLPSIGRLGALLVETHHAFDSRRFLAATSQTPANYASFLGTQLAEERIILLVAVRDTDVIGYSYAGVEGYDYMSLRAPAGVVYDLIVDPEHRGQGIGRLLLDTTLAHLKAHGVPRVVLSTAEQNEAAKRLFASVGFRRTMIEMTRELDDA